MERLTLRELAIPMIKAIDSFNLLLKSHHRRVAVIAYYLGRELHLSKERLIDLVIAASMHDIGALSVQERDMLIKEDVENPTPHCLMGYKMLRSFEPFSNVAKIVRYHHANFDSSNSEVPLESYIVHLADRVDIYINQEQFVLDQKEVVTEKIKERVGSVFSPEVFEAFKTVAKADLFWIDINNLPLDRVFNNIDFTSDFELSIENVLDFSKILAKVVDFRSRFTVSHSYTVANLVHYISGLLDYTFEQRNKLMISGFLHDIGKIGIDPNIVEKNDKLTDSEYNQMKLHSYYTGQILEELSDKPWFKDIVFWSTNHHEKEDGTGYPRGLDYSNLDQGTKMLTYADVITALMEDRPYRKALDVETTFEIIDEHLADSISRDMFNILKNHKKEIESLVNFSQAEQFAKYIEEITDSTRQS